MRNALWQRKSSRMTILAAAPLLCFGVPVIAQNATNQESRVIQDNRPAQFDLTTSRDLAELDRFLDSHPQTADQLRSKPWLVTNYDFLQANPDLKAYLQAHPQLAQAISQNPAGFVDQEERFDNPTYRRDLAEFDRFLDSHPNIAQQLRSKPWLATNYDFEQAHPDLRAFLQAHPQLSQTAGQNPVAFMQDEQTFDTGPNPADRDVNSGPSHEFGREQTARVNRDRDFDRRQSADFDRDRDRDFGQGRGTGVNREQNGINHGDLVVFDHFMDSHPEIAEQVRKNPSLLDNRRFVQSHPALQTFLQDHSQLRGAIAANPSSFMQAESNFDNREDARVTEQNSFSSDRDASARDGFNRHANVRDRDANASAQDRDANMRDRDQSTNVNREGKGDLNRDRLNHGDVVVFDHFLDRHPETAEQLRRNPSLINDKQFVQSHPALQTFLQNHSQLTGALSSNPGAFMQAENRYDAVENRRGSEFNREHLASFNAFMNEHSKLAREVSQKPDCLNDQKYINHHPELKEYFRSNPAVQQEAASNPQHFVQVAQQVNVNVNVTTGGSTSGSVSGSGNGSGSTAGASNSTSITGSSMTGATSTKGSTSAGTSTGAGATGTSTGTSRGSSSDTTTTPAPTTKPTK